MARVAKRNLMIVPVQTFAAKGIWMWEYERELLDPVGTVDFLRANHFTEVYITFNSVVSPWTQYRSFIGECTWYGIDVHALYGDPTWSLDSGVANALAEIQKVKTYNDDRGTLDTEKFKGVHMDNEAYLLPDWETNKRSICNQWVANTQQMVDATRAGGMIFGGAFPFWLDDILITEIDASVYPLHKEFINMMDYYAIMSYNDTVNGVKNIIENELAATSDKKIMFALETTDQMPQSVTFYDNGGYAAMQDVLVEVERATKYRPSYRGCAVHDYKQYHKEVGKTTQKAAKTVQAAKRSITAK